MRRTAALLGSLTLLVGVPAQAATRAAETPPAPTVTVNATVNGVTVTKALTKGSWTITNVGQIAQLNVDAHNLPGMLTTVDALWTSHGFTVYKGLPLLEYKAGASHLGYPTSSMPASFSYGFRTRVPGRAWGPWNDILVGYEAGTVEQGYSTDKKYLGTALRSGKVQVQFRMHLELTGVSRDSQTYWLIGYT